jgi:hypothetical protein
MGSGGENYTIAPRLSPLDRSRAGSLSANSAASRRPEFAGAHRAVLNVHFNGGVISAKRLVKSRIITPDTAADIAITRR